MSWFPTTFIWYLYLFILGLIFLPTTRRIFARFNFDSGYAFSKVIAILFLSFAIFLFGFLKIIEFSRSSIILFLVIAVIFNYYLYRKDKECLAFNWGIIFLEEFLFFFSLVLWTIIRGQEGSIHGLEKFMDFGFMNSILRSQYFPPLDMWYSGYPINYYYFGHLTGALLIKMTGIPANVGYNLILSTIFALSITQVFSFASNITHFFLSTLTKKIHVFLAGAIGLISTFILNLGGNLHTIYLFTKGYSLDNPVPFWQILSGFNPTKYWYPNATRFIPYTIHEFPSYSYVVADLHGHVFDIPYVILTIAILFLLITKKNDKNVLKDKKLAKGQSSYGRNLFKNIPLLATNYYLLTIILLGFLTAIHYMTNAFDGPIYLLLVVIVLFYIFRLSLSFFIGAVSLLIYFFIFSFPFSFNFSPFVSSIGLNCSPNFLVNLHKLGPFLFEKDKCQATPFWMLFVLWGFFWVCFAIFLFLRNRQLKESADRRFVRLGISDCETVKGTHLEQKNGYQAMSNIDNFILILFSFGTFLIIIPVFFYIKDIYPQHFRANTMFKLGYQAFIMMSIASGYTLFRIGILKNFITKFVLKIIFTFFFAFVAIYSFFAIPSYYGAITKPVQLDGAVWLKTNNLADYEIINYLNKNIDKQPVILEAQGDSYTDYGRISAFTGLPTIAGWWVHEWLWRGSSDVIGKRIPDVVDLYESNNLKRTEELIKKYNIKYVIISDMERQKYKNINENKFNKLGKKIFQTVDTNGAIYQLN